jgi:hypothetical protein
MKLNSIEELFGTLQQSVVEEWRKHLKTSKYSKHMALDEFYKEMPELVDDLIEDYIGHVQSKVDDYTNILNASDLDALQYLEELHSICQDGYKLLPDDAPELKSDLDNIKSMIDKTMYKLRELKESTIKSLSAYLMESIFDNDIANISKVFDIENDVKKFFSIIYPRYDFSKYYNLRGDTIVFRGLQYDNSNRLDVVFEKGQTVVKLMGEKSTMPIEEYSNMSFKWGGNILIQEYCIKKGVKLSDLILSSNGDSHVIRIETSQAKRTSQTINQLLNQFIDVNISPGDHITLMIGSQTDWVCDELDFLSNPKLKNCEAVAYWHPFSMRHDPVDLTSLKNCSCNKLLICTNSRQLGGFILGDDHKWPEMTPANIYDILNNNAEDSGLSDKVLDKIKSNLTQLTSNNHNTTIYLCAYAYSYPDISPALELSFKGNKLNFKYI